MGVQSRSTRVTDGLSRRGFLAASAAAGVAAAELGRLSDTESARAQGEAPTVLLDTVSAAVITPDDAAFVYTGAHEARTAVYPGIWFKPDSLTGGGGWPAAAVSFWHTGAQVELLVKPIPRGKYRLTVDGVRVSSDPQPLPSVGPIRLVVYWPSVARRQVLVELDHVPWGGVRIESSGLVEPVAAPSQRVIVLGDSVTAGTGALASFTGFVQSAAAILGWTDAWASGVGGTGYVNPGPPGQVAFINRVDHDVISYAPSVVLVAGGTNDHAYAPTDVQAAAAALYQRIADGLPAAVVYVMGPWCSKGPAPAQWVATRDALVSALSGFPSFRFIDNIAEQWITGTGNVAHPKGDGNADLYISADGTHPTQAGHDYVGQRLAADIQAMP